ncbi:periplasmic heavy metal sensor [Desulfovibrio sp. OttesenSCG-928-C14]|nr:periplasmic heavy metal sensor [Desulfovibrio sp. OttesenSCG-928-C14]
MSKSKLTLRLVAFVLLASLVLAGAAGAATGRAGMGPNRAAPAALTQEQQADLDAIYAEHYDQVLPLREQLFAKNAELDALYYAGSKDEQRVRAIYREIADIRAGLFVESQALRSALEAKGLQYAGGGMRHGHGGRGDRYGRGDYGRQGYGAGGGGYGPNSGNTGTRGYGYGPGNGSGPYR